MKDKILFFSIDRLGDYLIRSNVINCISKHYKKTDIICSNINYKLVNRQNFFNKVYLFDKSNKTINKIKFVYNFFFKKYDALISFDGKNISSILLLLIKADFKYIFIYKKKGSINNLKLSLYCFFLNFLNIKYEILNSRNIIEQNHLDHYPSKFKLLKKYFNNINNKTYYLENFKLDNEINFKEKFILIHLDEKFNDIKYIDSYLNKSLVNLSQKIKKKIILTSYRNKEKYYQNLEIRKIPFTNLDNIDHYKDKIFILENVPLVEFNYLISKSDYNISCHGGFFVHSSLLNEKKTIDIINDTEIKWVSAWITKSNDYKLLSKSNFSINRIMENLFDEINKI